MLLEKLKHVRKRIECAAARVGRNPSEIELVAVVKKSSLEQVRELFVSGGIRHFGENRIQDAFQRRQSLGSIAETAQWRFIGHLQMNKVRQALSLFDWVDSLDSLRLAEALDRRLGEAGLSKKILVQVKLSRREDQSGIAPEDLENFIDKLRNFRNLKTRGLMAIAPWLSPVETVRPYFRKMQELFKRHFPEATGENFLSMGMSRDLEIAVEEGSNMVRVGSALFENGA